MPKTVTVLTPSYNRQKELSALFKSLCDQTLYDFIWLIIDDGSNDQTAELVKSWEKTSLPFPIVFHRKENGGKHTALNVGFRLISTELTFIVDSDDVLSNTAIEEIVSIWNAVRSDRLSGISFLRGTSLSQTIGDPFPSDGVHNGIDIQFRYKITGDKAEVWRTDILRRYQFPVFKGERFQGENYVWWQIALEYDMYYVNKIIYITEYLEGGLTRSGRALRIRCPLGGMENSRMGLHPRFPLLERFKRAMLYVCYGKFAHKSIVEIIARSGYPPLIALSYLPGWLLYHYWKTKYL